MKLMIVLGEGGHTKEMLALVDLLGEGYRYAYLMTEQDQLSAPKIRIPGEQYRIIRPRNKEDAIWRALPKVVRSLWQSWRIMRRVRPHAIITCGPAIAIPACIWAKLLGAAVIFIETGSRIHQLSLTGKLVRYLADLYFVQWPQLQAAYPKAIYAGRLF